MFWFPTRRPTYRIVKIRDDFWEYESQQRKRWLWMEWWVRIDHHWKLHDAEELVQRYEALDAEHESERVVYR